MDIDYICHNHKKELRKLNILWETLSKPKNFLIPETIEDFKQLGYLSPRIKIGKTEYYFNEKSRRYLYDFANRLHGIKEINRFISYNSIYETAKTGIKEAVTAKLNNQQSSEKAVIQLLQALDTTISQFQFIQVIKGVSLKDTDLVKIGDEELFVFKESYKGEIYNHCRSKKSKDFLKSIEPFIDKYLINKICIRATSVGDEEKARELAIKKMKQFINLLRFVVCFYNCENIASARTQINFATELIPEDERGNLILNLKDRNIGIAGTSSRHLYDLPITNQLINELREKCFFDDLAFILKQANKTEFEENILTAIYWVGEAQNDFIRESAFIKYWTALEVIFSIKQDKITEKLVKGIPSLLIGGEWSFIEVADFKSIKKAVKRLYDKRSKIIHRGIYELLNPSELNEICKYAVLSVISCLELRRLGFRRLIEVENELNRLYDLVERKIKCKS